MVKFRRGLAVLAVSLLSVLAPAAVGAQPAPTPPPPTSTFGSVEPIANPTVLDTRDLRSRSLAVQEAFARRLFECGVVDHVVRLLTATGAVSTITAANTSFAVTAGGFNASTRPAYAYTVVDEGPGAASEADIEVLTNSLAYVLSQGSAFLLDPDDPTSFGFPANYVVLRFPGTPTLSESAALFDTVGRIDRQLFATSTSGYTQFGPSYVSLQSAVPDARFIAGYVRAAAEFGVEYTPTVGGVPSLYVGGADFPFNNWATNRGGEQYLGRIPAAAHAGLAQVRTTVLRVTEHALKVVQRGQPGRAASERGLLRALGNLPCRTGAPAATR